MANPETTFGSAPEENRMIQEMPRVTDGLETRLDPDSNKDDVSAVAIENAMDEAPKDQTETAVELKTDEAKIFAETFGLSPEMAESPVVRKLFAERFGGEAIAKAVAEGNTDSLFNDGEITLEHSEDGRQVKIAEKLTRKDEKYGEGTLNPADSVTFERKSETVSLFDDGGVKSEKTEVFTAYNNDQETRMKSRRGGIKEAVYGFRDEETQYDVNGKVVYRRIESGSSSTGETSLVSEKNGFAEFNHDDRNYPNGSKVIVRPSANPKEISVTYMERKKGEGNDIILSDEPIDAGSEEKASELDYGNSLAHIVGDIKAEREELNY